MLNELLQSQIHQHLGELSEIPKPYKELMEAISETYTQFERQQRLMERSIKVSSSELTALNTQIYQDILALGNVKKDLNENAANLQAIINNTEDTIFSVDEEYRILSANQSFLDKVSRYTGVHLKPGDLCISEVFGKEKTLEWKERIDRALAGEQFKIEIRESFNGETIYADVAFNPIREKDKIIGVGCFSRDITQEKLNAEKIKASETRFRLLIENNMDMISMLNADGTGIYISPSIERTFGYSASEVKDINTIELLHPDDLPVAGETFQKVITNPGVPISYSVRNRKKSGDYLWVEGTLTNLLHVNGINAIVGNFRDITDQKIAREKLQNTEANLQTIFNNTDSGYVLLDKELKVIYFNQNAQQFVREELHNHLVEGEYAFDFFPSERKEIIKSILLRVLTGETIQYDINYPQSDETEKWYNAKYFPVYNQEGIFSIILSITDFTKHKLAEQKIKQSNDRYELATKATNNAIWEWNILTGEIFWTDAYQENFGYKNSKEEGNIETWVKHIHPDDIKRVTEKINASLYNSSTNFWQDEYRFIKADGTIAYIHDRGHIIFNEKNQPVRMAGAMQDITERKKAEEELLKTDLQLREISSSIPGVVYQYKMDPEGLQSFPYMSEGAIDLFGVPVQEIYENPEECFRNIHLDDLDNFIESAVLSAKNMEPWLHSFRIKVNKEYKFIRGNSIPRLLEDGSIVWNGTMTDITDSKIIEDKLKNADYLLSEAQRLAKVGNWNVDFTKNEIFWSSGTRVIYGVDENFEASFDAFISMLHPEDKGRVLEELHNAEQTGETLDQEFRIIRKDGGIRIIKNQTRFELNQEGKTTRIFGISQDVTEIKTTTDTLRRSEANLRSIFDNTSTSYILLDTELRVRSFNPAATKWAYNSLNVTLEEQANWWSYFPRHHHKKLKAIGSRILRGEGYKDELKFLQKDNSIRYYDAIVNPVLNPEKAVLGICIAFKDITERKLSEMEREKMTSEILQRNKNLEQFSYIVSHNLRAPVANIIGISSALQEDDSDESIKSLLQQGLHESVLKLDEVILDLNNILQIKQEINERKEKVEFAKISTDIYASIQKQIQNSNAHIKWDFSEVEEMLTLKSYMQSIFYNLIFNSVKYRKPDLAPVIEIKSRKYPNKIELLFRDNCMGIDLAKNGEHIFGLYKRFHNNEVQGKGLGLFMVKTQVEAIGGKISVHSEVNKGTEFKIEFELRD